MVAEVLDTRRVAQVEPEDLQPVAPLREVRLLRVALRGIPREARRDDQRRARAEFDENPEEAKARPINEVESYRQ